MSNDRVVFFAFRAWFALIVAFAAAPAFAANGDCLQWNVSGPWSINQSNGTTVHMNLQQTGTHLQGVAEYSSYNNDAGRVQTVGGPVDGNLENGNFLRVTAYWSNSTAGLYSGQLEADGGINGFTVDKNDPGNKATFRASGSPVCTARETAPPPPAPVAADPARPAVRATSRIQPSGTPVKSSLTKCEAAKAARERNSPAAPGLEAQCAAELAKPAAPVIDDAWRDENSARGEALVSQDPRALELRSQFQSPEKIRAFNIGMAVAEGQTADGPGKRAIHDALAETEQRAFQIAVWYSLDRNANAELAAKGATIAGTDPTVAEARSGMSDPFYWLGFDIATGIFGDPALGASGNTAMGPGSMKIRDDLNPASAREGFNDAVKFHLARTYR